MVTIEEAVIARIVRGHKEFEILVDPDSALKLKKGIPVSIEDVVAIVEVFRDAKKGERAAESDLMEHFGTTDKLKICKIIIKNGELQLTTEQKRKMLEEKKKEIAEIISRQGINPQTNLPHPPARIINAMEQAHVNIDPFRPAKEQIEGVIKKIQEIIPISLERVEIEIRIPLQYAGSASSHIRSFAPIKKEEWRSDAWYAVMEIPAGMQGDILDKLNTLTSGNVDVKVKGKKRE